MRWFWVVVLLTGCGGRERSRDTAATQGEPSAGSGATPVTTAAVRVANLAITSHLGRPMMGEWAWPGIALCLVLAVGGLAVGAWGMSRRDVGT